MKFIKKTSIALALALMLSASGAAHAQGTLIYEKQNQEVLAKGIVYKNIYRFTEGGIVNINLIEADVRDSEVDFDVLYNKEGFSKRAKLSTMVSQSPDVVAAVNGDFFSMSSPSFSLGAIVKDGKLLSNPHYEEQKYASILVDGSRNVVFDYISPNVKAQNVARGVDVPVAAVNKPSQYYANIVAYTKEYSAKSPGATSAYYDVCEVVVDSGSVIDVRYGQPAVDIPENGYVLSAGGNNGLVLRDNFAAGEQVSLDTSLTLNYGDVETAMGAGSVLLKNGEYTPLTQNIKGKSQRTAIGLMPSGKLVMFTSDGRLTHSPGMDASEVAGYLKELGCTDAVMLDGGGSTELIAKGSIKNTLTDGSERAILNAFAVKSLSQKGAFDHLGGYLVKATSYVGEGVPVKLTFHDASGNQLDLGANSAQFTSSGISGYYSNGAFVPTSAGKGTVTASYGGTSISFELEAIEKTSSDSLFDSELTRSDLEGGTTLAFLGDMSMPKEQKLMDRLIVSKLQESIASLGASKAVVIGNNNSSGTAKLSGRLIDVKSGFRAIEIDPETAVVTLENSSGTFYKQAGQWNFINTILSSNYKNVIVVFTSKSQLGFADEVNIFKDNVYQAAKDKNICVVYKGSEFSQTVEGNARYVSIPDYADLSKGDFWNDYKYLAINIKPDGIKYGHVNIFKQTEN
ncbi:hypothetical protein EAL2_c03050 [Peptoclostridium acidaminophilum DSM 3953]|uniref:Phosphodiester glycosidase domain-containing protein n=1 Tax=Peptoclostridium acidaminophilum DSM 3953 TaxID=1286171 RepID=W8TCS9_PEPAC|nr:phosphodiester glycosidase family protein [Peptoclostridium acidaminophilum]AHM55608.1 hypothetical protein EAL2_c03050 [Peptoclostridium acidaminophilum DSM 3953]